MLEIVQSSSSHVPVLFCGPPGIGKTEIIKSHFDYTEVMLVSAMVEEDIAGLPYREGDFDFRTIPAPFFNLAKAHREGKTTCLFLDELDKARRSVADTLLTLVASRKIGRNELPANTVIIAAANPPEFGGGDGIGDAMRSRFSVINAEPDVIRWIEWARKNFNSANAVSIIDNIENGNIPFIDIAGEEMQKRITCPRTLTMIIQYVETGHANQSVVKKLADGLLTANSASRMMLALQASPRDADVVHKSRSIRASVESTNKNGPIRL